MEKSFGEELDIEIKLPARVESVPALLDFVVRHGKETGLDESKAKQVATGIEEALLNIITFASEEGDGEIEIRCGTFGEDKFLIDIIDSCKPFNMLIATTFPETEDFAQGPELHRLSTAKLKKVIKNVEYRRDFKKGQNILACIVSKSVWK
jgi:anti-sigma regulatory factor (Ser/Thr protein kinase)